MVYLHFKPNGDTYVSWSGSPKYGDLNAMDWSNEYSNGNTLADAKARKYAELNNEATEHFNKILSRITQISDSHEAFNDFIGKDHELIKLQLAQAEFFSSYLDELSNSTTENEIDSIRYEKEKNPLEMKYPPATPEA